MQKRVVIFLLISLLSTTLCAKTIGTDMGLSDQQTFSIVKDPIGFLWFTTRAGIDRYDGIHIVHYSLLDSRGNDLAGRINSALLTPSHRLWAYNNTGHIWEYDRASDHFRMIYALGDSLHLPNVYINQLYFVSDTSLYIAHANGVVVLNLNNQTIRTLPQLTDDNVFTMCSLPSGIALGTQQHLLVVQDALVDTLLSNQRIQDLLYDSASNQLFIGTALGNLYAMSNGKITLLQSYDAYVRDLAIFDHVLYVATDGQGLHQVVIHPPLSTAGTILAHTTYTGPYSLYNILIDQGRIWLSTHANGIYCIDSNQPHFATYANPFVDKSEDNAMNAVLQDRNGNLWIAGNQGVCCITPLGKQHYVLKDAGNQLDNNILALCEDHDGHIWAAGSFGLPAIAINTSNATIDYRIHLPFSWKNERTYSLCMDAENQLWFGGLQMPLTRYNISSNTYKTYPLDHVNYMVEHNHLLYVCTSNGLYSLDYHTDSIYYITQHLHLTINQQFVHHVSFPMATTISLATEGGLVLLENGHVPTLDTVLTTTNGLLSNILFAAFPDNNQHLWISTSRGLSQVSLKTYSIQSYNAFEGLEKEHFKARFFYQTSNGEILLGSANQIIGFDPENINPSATKQNLVFTGLDLLNRPAVLHVKGRRAPTSMDKVRQIILLHKQNSFSIHFANINFSNPQNYSFRWKLDRYDKQWIQAPTDATSASYANVPTGKYTFHLQLISRDNNQLMAERALQLIVKPHLLLTWPFILLYTILIAVLFYIFIRLIIYQARESYFTSKLDFFIHSAHELKSPLTLIKGPLSQLTKSHDLNDSDNALLDLALRNTQRLYDMILQLLDIERFDHGLSQLTLSYINISQSILQQIAALAPLAEEKNIEISTDIQPDSMGWCDEEKLVRILTNLLSNAIKYTSDNGHVNVSYALSETKHEIRIADDGIGIPKRNLQRIYQPFFRADNVPNDLESGTGLGLTLVHNLVKAHLGTLTCQSQEGVGTTFILRLPAQYSQRKHKFISPKTVAANVNLVQVNNSISPNDVRIMIVDDNDDIRTLISQALPPKYQIFHAQDGQQAMEMLTKINPDVLIADIMMPKMSGLELCKRVKQDQTTSHIFIILLSALDTPQHIQRGYANGADAYITKPFDLDTIIHNINNLIQTRQAIAKQLIAGAGSTSNEKTSLDGLNELDRKFMDKVIQTIEANLDDSEYTIDQLASTMAMSRTSFFNKMKALTHIGPNEFIRSYRLHHAAKMLQQHQFTIAEVAYSSGFGDVKYFSTTFKKQFGVSPSQYE